MNLYNFSFSKHCENCTTVYITLDIRNYLLVSSFSAVDSYDSKLKLKINIQSPHTVRVYRCDNIWIFLSNDIPVGRWLFHSKCMSWFLESLKSMQFNWIIQFILKIYGKIYFIFFKWWWIIRKLLNINWWNRLTFIFEKKNIKKFEYLLFFYWK